jgi:hypothetical protein
VKDVIPKKEVKAMAKRIAVKKKGTKKKATKKKVAKKKATKKKATKKKATKMAFISPSNTCCLSTLIKPH